MAEDLRAVEHELKQGMASVERAQAELLRLVDDLMREPDQGRKNELVHRIGERSEALRASCAALEARARSVAREERGFVEVALTPEQRRVVEEGTGTRLDYVRISDDSGGLMQAMPTMPPHEVLAYAVTEGERQARAAKARQAARAQLDQVREDLRHAPEQIRREMERMLEDPDFKRAFGGEL